MKSASFARWVETYSSEEFSNSTNEVISLLDNLAKECSRKVLERMKNAFEYSAFLEWHFWDDAYTQTTSAVKKLKEDTYTIF